MKQIGLLTDVTDEGKINLNLAYFRFAEKFGAVTLLHPWDTNIRDDLSLLIVPGGPDVNPLRYNQIKLPWACGNQHTNFEYWDLAVMPGYIANKTPFYTICRGFQTINVHFGGSLFQDIDDEPTSANRRGQLVHFIEDVKTKQVMACNSLHHQAIDKLGDGLEVTLQGFKVIKKKGRKNLQIEGIRHKELPILGGQFHLEELNPEDENSQPLIDWSMREIFSIMK